MAMLRRLSYWIVGGIRMLLGVRNPLFVLAAMLGLVAPGRAPMLISTPRMQMWVRTRMDMWAVQETILDRHYERFGYAVQDGWNVLDVGGGIGEFALLVAREHPSCRVVAFEPFEGSVRALERNRDENGLEATVVRPEAVASRNGRLRLVTFGRSPGEHLVTEAAGDDGDVECVDLGTALNRAGMDQCDLAKIDCEGSEFEILLQAPDDVVRRVRRMVIEYHDDLTSHDHGELTERLERAGYRVERFPSIHDGLGYLRAAPPEP